MLKGSLVAIVSPMFEDGSLDLDAFRRLVDWHIVEGTGGIVVVGTTGESPTVDFEEHTLLIKTAIEQAAGRCQSAGTGAARRARPSICRHSPRRQAPTYACLWFRITTGQLRRDSSVISERSPKPSTFP